MTEPSYLPLLRAAATAEANAERWLSAWAEATPDAEVRQVLSTIALREGDHAKAVAKRIDELGFACAAAEDPALAGKLEVVCSPVLSDLEKFDKLGLGQPADTSAPDRWASWFEDKSIDIGTGELLGRFISEERDSVRLLAGCRAALAAAAGEQATPSAGGSAEQDRLARIEHLLEELLTKLS